MKKTLLFICSCLLVAVIVSLSACSPSVPEEPTDDSCIEHLDGDGDYACDKCGALVLPEEDDTAVTVDFTVMDNEGSTLAGINVILVPTSEGSDLSYSAVSGADGNFSLSLETGDYFVIYDYDIDAIGYYLTDTSEIKVARDTDELTLYLINNNPNGTPEKPFALVAGDNSIVVPENTSYNYIVYRAVKLFVTIECDGAKVIYRDTEYLPVDGVITFYLLGEDTNSTEGFVIENVTEEKIEFNATVNSLPGTLGNPYVIENLGAEITHDGLTSEDIIYYSFVADTDGKLCLRVLSESTGASMMNASNSVTVGTFESESEVIYIDVSVGDEIIIDLSTSVDENGTVSFVLDYVDETID